MFAALGGDCQGDGRCLQCDIIKSKKRGTVHVLSAYCVDINFDPII